MLTVFHISLCNFRFYSLVAFVMAIFFCVWQAAEDAVNVFYHYTYEGNVDIDAVSDPTMKASILAQINHFGQTPKQLFQKAHPQRRTDRKIPPHPLRYSTYLTHQEIRKTASSVSQIVTYNDKILIAASNSLLKPVAYSEYISWGFPDRSLRILTYDQDRLQSTHDDTTYQSF